MTNLKTYLEVLASLALVTLKDKVADLFESFVSAFQQGAEILILPVGDVAHVWNPRKGITSPAFKAFLLESGVATEDKWISPKSLAGGWVYDKRPTGEWSETTNPAQEANWWIYKATDETDGFFWGLAAAKLPGAITNDDQGPHLAGALIIKVAERRKGFSSQPVPANAAAEAILAAAKMPKPARMPAKEENGFTSQNVWLGEARWASLEDLKKAFGVTAASGKAVDQLRSYLKK